MNPNPLPRVVGVNLADKLAAHPQPMFNPQPVATPNGYMAALRAQVEGIAKPPGPGQMPSMYRPNSTPLYRGANPPTSPFMTPPKPVPPAVPRLGGRMGGMPHNTFARTPTNIPLRQANTANKRISTPFSDYRGTTMGSPSGHLSSMKGFSS